MHSSCMLHREPGKKVECNNNNDLFIELQKMQAINIVWLTIKLSKLFLYIKTMQVELVEKVLKQEDLNPTSHHIYTTQCSLY